LAILNNPTLLQPILALIVWSLVVLVWLYATRIPAMSKAGIKPGAAAEGAMNTLPAGVRSVADNYNHLMEQPTLFYALAVYTYLAGHQDDLTIGLAWVYVALRVLHSLVQNLGNVIIVRFSIFGLSSILLMIWAGREVWALFGG
jgi:hypothetical protein